MLRSYGVVPEESVESHHGPSGVEEDDDEREGRNPGRVLSPTWDRPS